MNSRADGPTRSDSPEIGHHAGHRIGALEAPPPSLFPEGPQRTVPGNAWCFNCGVPIAGNWSKDFGIRALNDPLGR